MTSYLFADEFHGFERQQICIPTNTLKINIQSHFLPPGAAEAYQLKSLKRQQNAKVAFTFARFVLQNVKFDIQILLFSHTKKIQLGEVATLLGIYFFLEDYISHSSATIASLTLAPQSKSAE